MSRSSLMKLTAMALLLASAHAARAAAVTLKFATIAPDGSAWMQRFDQMKKEVSDATGGQVILKVYPGGVLGEEKDVLFKIKVGQVDGGGFMGHGVGVICPDARALMLPMKFKNYEEVDAVLEKMQPYLEAQCEKNGFIALGWTEIGFSYLYSVMPVRSIKDLRGAKPWTLPDERMLNVLFKHAKISAIPLPVADVLTGLQTGLIQTVYAPPLAAVVMQWYTKIKFRNDMRLGYSFGGMFVSKASWNKIPADLQPKVLEICHRHMKELTKSVRKSDAEALKVLSDNGVQAVTSTPADIKEFEEVSALALAEQKATLLPPEVCDMVQKYLDDYRAAQGAAAKP